MPKRLLILNCSGRKSDEEFCSAITRYQSPVYFVVRRYLRLNPVNNLVIWILSGKYGLIDADKNTVHYNTVMTEERARELQGRINRQYVELMRKYFQGEKIGEVFCHLSANYQLAFQSQLKRLEKSSSVTISVGRPGEKSKMLKEWLEREKSNV